MKRCQKCGHVNFKPKEKCPECGDKYTGYSCNPLSGSTLDPMHRSDGSYYSSGHTTVEGRKTK